jgi:chemotaxis protein MotB
MAKWGLAFVVLLLAAAAAAWFWLYEPQRQALQEAREKGAAAEREVASLRVQVADLEAIRDRLRKTSDELQEAVSAKEKELQALHSTQDELVEGLQKEIADKQIEVERIRDQIRVQMVDEILFDSGEATIKPAGLEVLKRVGAVLKKTEGRNIEVQGHTDNVPIVGALAKRFPTNWELSSARATNVARFLIEQAGVDPRRISAAAYSEYRPRGTNETEAGRRRNRRIEILLGPVVPAGEPGGEGNAGAGKAPNTSGGKDGSAPEEAAAP